MELEVGSIHSGKVTGIVKFGAFVSLEGGKSGLVHISEVANTFVSDVSQFLQVGQEVNVKVTGIDETGRISLSIKKALPQEEKPAARPARSRTAGSRPTRQPTAQQGAKEQELPQSFEDKLKRFMQESDSKMSDINKNRDKRSGARRRSR